MRAEVAAESTEVRAQLAASLSAQELLEQAKAAAEASAHSAAEQCKTLSLRNSVLEEDIAQLYRFGLLQW